jgi:putative hemolysin
MDPNLYRILLALLMITLAGLFAGSETGIYRLSRLRLRLGVEKGRWSSILLATALHDSSGLLLTLLVGTNLSHYVATSSITSIFLRAAASERAAEIYATLLTAPLLFVFSELVPKNVFLHRADRLTSLVAPLLYVSHKLFTWCGIVPLLKLTSRLFARLLGSPATPEITVMTSQSQQVRALLRDTREEGLLSTVQSEMLDRIVNIPGVRLDAVMVPLSRVQMVEIHCDRAMLLEQLRRHALTRLLVWQEAPENVVGFLDIYEALGADEEFTSVERFLQPLRSMDAGTPIIDALEVMRREQRKIILVTRRRGKRAVPAGIVTMKDLVEELMGELAEW